MTRVANLRKKKWLNNQIKGEIPAQRDMKIDNGIFFIQSFMVGALVFVKREALFLSYLRGSP